MPKVKVEREHSLPRPELEKRAEEFIKRFAEKMSAVKLEYEWRPDKSGIDFKGKGFSGAAELGDTKVSITVDLSLMLSAFKGTVEKELNKQLDKMLS